MAYLKYTAFVDTKFSKKCRPLAYPGCSYISFIRPDTDQFKLFIWARRLLKNSNIVQHFALLPPSSYHMTLMDLLCDKLRETPYWTNRIPIHLAFPFVRKKVINMQRSLKLTKGFKMIYSGIANDNGLILYKPADYGSEVRLKKYRSQISKYLGIKYPNHFLINFILPFFIL